MVECTRLESAQTFTGFGGSNPPLSAKKIPQCGIFLFRPFDGAQDRPELCRMGERSRETKNLDL